MHKTEKKRYTDHAIVYTTTAVAWMQCVNIKLSVCEYIYYLLITQATESLNTAPVSHSSRVAMAMTSS